MCCMRQERTYTEIVFPTFLRPRKLFFRLQNLKHFSQNWHTHTVLLYSSTIHFVYVGGYQVSVPALCEASLVEQGPLGHFLIHICSEYIITTWSL